MKRKQDEIIEINDNSEEELYQVDEYTKLVFNRMVKEYFIGVANPFEARFSEDSLTRIEDILKNEKKINEITLVVQKAKLSHITRRQLIYSFYEMFEFYDINLDQYDKVVYNLLPTLINYKEILENKKKISTFLGFYLNDFCKNYNLPSPLPTGDYKELYRETTDKINRIKQLISTFLIDVSADFLILDTTIIESKRKNRNPKNPGESKETVEEFFIHGNNIDNVEGNNDYHKNIHFDMNKIPNYKGRMEYYYNIYEKNYIDIFGFDKNKFYERSIITLYAKRAIYAHFYMNKILNYDESNSFQQEKIKDFIIFNALHISVLNLFCCSFEKDLEPKLGTRERPGAMLDELIEEEKENKEKRRKRIDYYNSEQLIGMNGGGLYFYFLYFDSLTDDNIYEPLNVEKIFDYTKTLESKRINNSFYEFQIEGIIVRPIQNPFDNNTFSFYSFDYRMNELKVIEARYSIEPEESHTFLPPLNHNLKERENIFQNLSTLPFFNYDTHEYFDFNNGFTYCIPHDSEKTISLLKDNELYEYCKGKIYNLIKNRVRREDLIEKTQIYFNVVFLMFIFVERSFYSTKVFFEFENISILLRKGDIAKDSIYPIRCIETYGINKIEKDFRPLGNISIIEVEQYINQLKWRFKGYLSFYIIFYIGGNAPVRNYASVQDDLLSYTYCISMEDDYRVLCIPIERLDNHFLTALMDFDYGEKNFFEYYKRVKANSKLLYNFDLEKITRIEISLNNFASKPEKLTKLDGGYLPLKLKHYNEELDDFCIKVQIFDSEFKNTLNVNCFIWSLIVTNKYYNIFSDKELFEINLKYGTENVSLKKINDFCNEYKISITIKKICVFLQNLTKEKDNNSISIKDSKHHIIIGYIQYNNFKHFFPIVPTKISHYCCKKLSLLKQEYYKVSARGDSIIQNKEIIDKKRLRYLKDEDKKGWASTFDLFKRLIEDNLLDVLSAYEMEKYSYNMKEADPKIEYVMKYPSSQSKIIEIDEEYDLKKTFIKNKLAVADTETYVDNNNIVPFCLCLIYLNEDNEIIKKSFYNEDCQDDFLDYCATNKIREIYFHNLKFDGWLFKNYKIRDMIYHASRLYSITIICNDGNKKKKVILKDSLALIPTKLKNFNKMFELGEIEKELYPYNKINKTVVFQNELLIDDCKNEFSNEDYDKFKEMLFKNKFIKNENKIDIEKLTIFYCMRDCEVLFYGLKKFEQMTMNLFNNINGLNFITISGLSYYIMKKNCFKDLEAYTGDIKGFIRKSIRGGRCMVRRNQKIKVDAEVVDFDACSLYPSAMNRLFLPTGNVYASNNEEEIKELFEKRLMLENQIIEDNNRNVSAMIIKCKIKRINKERDFPLLSYVKDGISYYNNNMEGRIVYLTHFELEDFIKYQEGSVEFLEAIYWKGSKDTRMSNYIKECYELRKKYKKEGNQLQEVLKLFMNSSYGKTIQKDIKEDYRFYDKRSGDKFLKNNYGRIKEIIEINPQTYWFKLDGINELTFIPCHIGALILGMSKRIMNEVICTAEDNNIDVYYQDTDSIHIKKQDVKSLADAFEARFGRELIGLEMGQFHVDFPLIDNKETWSKRSIFLGKKCYIDCLINTEGKEEDFIRMKGVPERVVKNTAKDMKIELYDLYDSMFKGEEIKFDLLNSNMPSFEYQKNFGIRLRNSFERVLKFN